MERKGVNATGVPILEPKQWITCLYNTCIMNVLDIPHFGRGKDISNCITRSSAQKELCDWIGQSQLTSI
jgi:hypothetical protein